MKEIPNDISKKILSGILQKTPGDTRIPEVLPGDIFAEDLAETKKTFRHFVDNHWKNVWKKVFQWIFGRIPRRTGGPSACTYIKTSWFFLMCQWTYNGVLSAGHDDRIFGEIPEVSPEKILKNPSRELWINPEKSLDAYLQELLLKRPE